MNILCHSGHGSLASGDQRLLDFRFSNTFCFSMICFTGIVLDEMQLASYKLFQVRSWYWLAKCVTIEGGCGEPTWEITLLIFECTRHRWVREEEPWGTSSRKDRKLEDGSGLGEEDLLILPTEETHWRKNQNLIVNVLREKKNSFPEVSLRDLLSWTDSGKVAQINS